MALLLTVGVCGLNWRGGWARWCRNLMSSMTISLSDDATKISVSTEFSAALRFFHVSIFTTHVWAFGGMSVWNWCILIIHLRSSTQHVHACPDFRPSLTPFRFRNSSGWASDVVYAGDELGAEAKHEIFSVVFFFELFHSLWHIDWLCFTSFAGRLPRRVTRFKRENQWWRQRAREEEEIRNCLSTNELCALIDVLLGRRIQHWLEFSPYLDFINNISPLQQQQRASCCTIHHQRAMQWKHLCI